MLRKTINKHLKSEFVRNGALLVSGNVIGQGVAMLAYIILARLYTSEDFGVFSYFLTVTGLLAIFSTACYEEAFLVTKNEKEELSLLSLVCRILFVFSGVLFLALWLLKIFSPSIFQVETVAQYWYLIPLMVFFTGFFVSLTGLANRERRYKSIATAKISLNVESSALKILFGVFTLGGFGLMLGNVIAQATACLSYTQFRTKFQSLFKYRKELSVKQAAKEFKAFPLYTMPRNFISSFSANLPVLMLTAIFGEAKLGLFSFAFALIFSPIHVVSSSIYQVLFEKITSLKFENKSIRPAIRKYCTKMGLIILPLLVIAFAIATPFFSFVFGSGWIESAKYFRYILPWMMMLLLTRSISFIPILLQKQRIALWFELLFLVARIGVLYIGIWVGSFETGILLYSGVGFLFLFGMLMWYFTLVKKYENSLCVNDSA